MINFNSPYSLIFALSANYLRNSLEFGWVDQYYGASIFQPTFNHVPCLPGIRLTQTGG
ncbi:hypothetical protein EMIT091MI3_90129 [Kosakonia quasisacchari]